MVRDSTIRLPDTNAEIGLAAPRATDEVAIADIWRIVWRRRWGILAAALACSGLAIAYSLLTPPLYAATGQLLIDPRDRAVVANDVNPTALSPDGGVAQVESQSKVLESSGVLLRVVRKLGLADDPEFGPDRPRDLFLLRGSGDAAPEGTTQPAEPGIGSAREMATIEKLRKRLTIKRAEKVLVIDVGMTARAPDKAAAIVNAILAAYLDDQAAAKADAAERVSKALSERLDDQRRKLRAAEDAVESYKALHDILEANNLSVSDERLAAVSAQLTSARAQTALMRTRLDQASADLAAGEGATADAVRSTTIGDLRNQEAALLLKVSDLQRSYGARYPGLRNLQSQLSEVRRLLADELARLRKVAERNYQGALAYETSLAERLDSLKRDKAEGDRDQVELRELEREVEASRTVYSSYLLRAQETREQAGIDTSNVRVISWAAAPTKKSWPPTPILALVAFGGGLGLAASGALVAESLSPRIFSRPQLLRVTGAPDLGTIPTGRRRRRRKGAPGGSDPAAAAALRSLLAEKSSLEDGPVRAIAVLCGRDGAGDAHAASHRLAEAALDYGLAVLLVEWGRPAEARDPPGLLDFIRGEARLVAEAPGAGPTVISRGRTRTGDLGLGAAAQRFLAEAGRRFDILILDGGLLAEDSRLLSIMPAIDDAVLVARLGQTKQADAAANAEALARLGKRLTATLVAEPRRAA
ncbi:GumC family protein [Aureimonas endophytica]|uniref:GumC family protein n=1 Tax=Aureimonas endophytica TaxID=2027858 RepID=UPI001AEEDE70|nr:GumC family protein [Aureimonas endophytica]